MFVNTSRCFLNKWVIWFGGAIPKWDGIYHCKYALSQINAYLGGVEVCMNMLQKKRAFILSIIFTILVGICCTTASAETENQDKASLDSSFYRT